MSSTSEHAHKRAVASKPPLATKRLSSEPVGKKAIGLLLTPIMLVISCLTATPAHAHEVDHKVEVISGIFVFDHETFGDGETNNETHRQPLVVGPWRTEDVARADTCAGGEARGEVHVTVRDSNNPGWVEAKIDAALYEGTRCDTQDNVANWHGQWFSIAPNQNSAPLVVRNIGWPGGDYMDLSVTVRNNV